MQFGDAPDDGQAQPAALGRDLPATVEALGQPIEFVCGHARTIVAHPQADALRTVRADLYTAARGRLAHRVLDQVAQRHGDHFRIAGDHDRRLRCFDRQGHALLVRQVG